MRTEILTLCGRTPGVVMAWAALDNAVVAAIAGEDGGLWVLRPSFDRSWAITARTALPTGIAFRPSAVAVLPAVRGKALSESRRAGGVHRGL